MEIERSQCKHQFKHNRFVQANGWGPQPTLTRRKKSKEHLGTEIGTFTIAVKNEFRRWLQLRSKGHLNFTSSPQTRCGCCWYHWGHTELIWEVPGVIWRFLIWFTAVIKHLGGKFDRLTKHWPCLLPFLLQSCSYTSQYNFQELCTGRGGFCAGQLKILTQMVALWKLIATNTNMDRKNSIWRPDGLNLYITISCVVVRTIGSRWNTELGRSYPERSRK